MTKPPRSPLRPAPAAALLLGLALNSAPLAQTPPAPAGLTPYQEAFVACQSGKFAAALAGADAALAKQPDDAAWLLLKGRALIKLGKFKEAQDALFHASDRQPDLPEVHYYLGESSFRQGRWGEAAAYYRIFLGQVPDSRETLLKIIYCHLAAGDLAGAARLTTGLDPADEQSPAYYFARAALAFTANRTADYRQPLQQARTIYGNDMFSEFEPDLLFVLKKISPAGK